MKLIKENIKIRSIILLFVLLYSCSESFLEPEPLSFFAPENVLVNEAGLQSVLDNALHSLKGEYGGNFAPFLVNMKYSDVAVDGTTDKADPWQDLNNQMLPDGVLNHNRSTKIGWYWDDSYGVIKDCNTVISRANAAEFRSEASKNALLGGAYFLRAFRYYDKTLQYGDVPLVLEEIASPRLDFYSTTKESIWKKMIKDLEFAAEHVPEANMVNRGQVTKGAVKHLLAKYYLLEGRFGDAIRLTTEIIDGGIHRLNTQRFGSDMDLADKDVIWDMHRVENKSIAQNTEGLLVTIDRYGMIGSTSGTFSMRNAVPFYGGTGVIKTPDGANGMTDLAGREFGIVEKYGRGVANIRPTWYSQSGVWTINGVEDFNDYRHRTDNGNWVTMEMLVYNNPALKGENEWYGQNLRLYNDDGMLLCADTIRSWHSWPHYKIFVPDPDKVRPDGGPGDWYIYRLAETYLLRAEAYIWNQEWQKAADDINTIRERANAQYMYTANDIQTQTIGAVLDERNRELYMEEKRQVELTRMAIIFARTGIQCYNGKTYSMDNIHNDNFYYDRVVEISDFYNKPDAITVYGNIFTISPYHIFWPVPAYAIASNTRGIINQNVGYPGAENNVTPLVYDGN